LLPQRQAGRRRKLFFTRLFFTRLKPANAFQNVPRARVGGVELVGIMKLPAHMAAGQNGRADRLHPFFQPANFCHATFAVHRLRRWYRQGVELSGRLPWLSTYMGHANILGTEAYLTTTPELLSLVSRRFEARFRTVRKLP
jgi:integrase